MIGPDLESRLSQSGFVAVVTIQRSEDAVPLAQALVSGGVSVIELTFRTKIAAKAIRLIRAEVPDVVVGAGTVLNRDHIKQAIDAGAAFGVAPGCNVTTIVAAQSLGLPFAPGIATPTDIEMAMTHGCRVMKYFPAASSGGLEHLAVMAAPFLHLRPTFIPLGGITAENLQRYATSPLVLCVGGSWISPVELIERKDWAAIRARAAEASAIVEAARVAKRSVTSNPQ